MMSLSIFSVVSVGGDGSFVICLNAMMKRAATEAGIDINNPETDVVSPPLPLGIIPAGK